jgi:DNA-binding CsgD family transcriptional regulator
VKTHVAHVIAKLGADNRSRAVAVARERGLLE